MSVKSVISFTVITLWLSVKVIAQNPVSPGLTNLTPASPNTASLGKYGDIPVGYYTGIPNISLPLFNIKSRELELPVSLNYHAGGIKVEEQASWVGLGFSLNAGGVITRSVRGLPDDYSDGTTHYADVANLAKNYMANPGGGSQNYLFGTGNGQTDDLPTLGAIKDGVNDGEADIFYFNFGKYSGKFFLDENGQFAVSPAEALKIEYTTNTYVAPHDAAQWILTTPDGVQYYFGISSDSARSAVEKNDNGGTRVAVTGWYLLDIISPNKDHITLNYETINYNYLIKSGEVINQIVDQINGESNALPAFEKNVTTNYMSVPRLTSINFANGILVFEGQSGRTDLPGEYSLASVALYNTSDYSVNPIKKFEFQYSYSLGSRLTLESFDEVSAAGDLSGNTYSFEYNGPTLPDADPYGTAINSQDIWGYYNGMPNAILPQSFFISSPDYPTIAINGADRHPDYNYMKAGTLSKIHYPTGGYIQFDYEPNTVYSFANTDDLPTPPDPQLAGFAYQIGETKTEDFTVSNTLTGSAVISVVSHSQTAGCPLSPSGFSQCYYAYIEGINGTSFSHLDFKDGTSTITLPEGQYRITGQGVSYPGAPSTNTFYLNLSWLEYPPPTGEGGSGTMTNVTVGGLRILRITSNDGIKSTVKKYLYNRFDSTNASSGVLVNNPSPYASLFEFFESTGATTVYAQVRSYPLIPLLTTQGAPIGYANVTELDGENGENGKTEYTFTTASNFPDEIRDYRPFPPPVSYDWRRGLLVNSVIYKNDGGTFLPLKSVHSEYDFAINTRTGFGIKIETDIKQIQGGTYTLLIGGNDYYVAGYKTISEFFHQLTQTTRIYDQNNSSLYSESTTTFTYDQDKGHYQLIRTVTQNSKNQDIQTDYKYPEDVTLTDDAETARQDMISKFIRSPILEQTVTKGGVQQTDLKNYYKIVNTNLVLPESIEVTIKNNSPAKRVYFTDYDQYGNLREQHKSSDINEVYLWGYNNAYPVAKVVGSDINIVSDFINQSTLDNADGTVSDQQMRDELDKIRTGLAGTKALVTTYTYSAAVGMTSQTDPNGRTIYYEYDAFGRLKLIRDQDNNILKTFDYKYQQ